MTRSARLAAPARPAAAATAARPPATAARRLRILAPAAALAAAAGRAIAAGTGADAGTAAGRAGAGSPPFRVVTVCDGLEHPWSLAFLPDPEGGLLVTERPGRLRRVSAEGRLSAPLAGLPKIHARGQGGLLDVTLGPDFARDRSVFFSYAESASGGARTAVARARLDGQGLRDVQTVFRQTPAVNSSRHWGCRLVFDRGGNLFITLGDRGSQSARAQELDSHIGKIVRIRPDGGIPPDNPFVGRPGALPEIWSIGHRNVQGAALHPQTGALWTHEHGARGGDELNLPQAGRNYGWPVITHGVDYSGLPIGVGSAAPGMEQPLLHWTPSIAPSGMAFYTGERFPAWRGNLFVGALKDRMLVRIELDGTRVTGQELLLQSLGERIRDVRTGPDGHLYLLTDASDGRILRLEPS